MPQGKLIVFYVPTVDDQMTYKFYPYAFNIEQAGSGYNNPNAPHVPSLIASRRYAFERMVPSIGTIVITNNGPAQYNLSN